jgi:excisionase family DNA binding protein
MSKTLTDEDIKAIGKEIAKEMEVIIENCLKKINIIESTSTAELITVDEISEILKLSKQSIYKIIKEEELKSLKIGKNFYVKRNDFNNYINSKY